MECKLNLSFLQGSSSRYRREGIVPLRYTAAKTKLPRLHQKQHFEFCSITSTKAIKVLGNLILQQNPTAKLSLERNAGLYKHIQSDLHFLSAKPIGIILVYFYFLNTAGRRFEWAVCYQRPAWLRLNQKTSLFIFQNTGEPGQNWLPALGCQRFKWRLLCK